MKWEQLCKLGCELPGVSEGSWYRTPALKVRGKGFVRLKEDGASVVFLLDDPDDQELLIAQQPELYHVTAHYVGYASVLARLAKLRAPECRLRLERAWLQKAPPKLVADLEGEHVPRTPRRRTRASSRRARKGRRLLARRAPRGGGSSTSL